MEFYQNSEFKGTDYDGSVKPKFSDLPTEILFKILDELDPIHKLLTRSVSRQLRSIIDCLPPDIKQLTFCDDYGLLKVIIDEEDEINFKDGCEVSFRTIRKTIEGACHVELALDFLRPILSNPKLKLENLNLYQAGNNMEILNKFIDFLANLRIHLEVKILTIQLDNSANLNRLMSFLMPGHLESIEIDLPEGIQCGLLEFLNTEQFKKAKTARLVDNEPLDPSEIHRFLHLSDFDFQLTSFSIQDFFSLRAALSTSDVFEKCAFFVHRHLILEELAEALGEELLVGRFMNHYYPFANSNDTLHFSFANSSIVIQRIHD
ncbi:unnamed protein product [Caenorhabditis brenneri]